MQCLTPRRLVIRSIFGFLPILCLLALFSGVSSAQITQHSKWTALAGFWGDGVNWNNGVPNAAFVATIDNGGTVLLTTGTAEVSEFLLHSGAMVISNGATFTNLNNNISFTSTIGGTGGTAFLTIDGPGSRFNGGIAVGTAGGTGTIRVQNGGLMTGGTLYLGDDGDGTGTMVVTGAGSRVELTTSNPNAPFGGAMSVGFAGTGRLTIENGGYVESVRGAIATAQSSNINQISDGEAIIDGAGSQWIMSEELQVGGFGRASIIVRNGGYARAGLGYVGTYTYDATVLVEGANSHLFITGDMDVRTATMASGITVQNGGLVTIGGKLILTDEFDTDIARVTINSGGTIQMGGENATTLGVGVIVFQLAGGTLRVNGSNLSANVPIALSGTTSVIDTNGLNASLSGTISGAQFTKTGGGILRLSGTNTHTGPTLVSGGGLYINGNHTAATGLVTVQNGATLGGTGVLGGDVVIESGGHLAAGNSPGQLTMRNLTLNGGAILDYELGAANAPGDALNDVVQVNGNLVLDGTLNVTASAGGSFGPGLYRLFNYTGGLTNNGLDMGSAPVPGSELYVQTSVANQVNLINTQGLVLNFWDGGNVANINNGQVDGGNGTWILGAPNDRWTDADGNVNVPYENGQFVIFQGTPGTVTVDNSNGNVTFDGAQFAVDGYVINGGTLTGDSQITIIRVGDGTSAGSGMTAIISAEIAGNTQLEKRDLGTLVLSGNNTYTGGTVINQGILRVSSDSNLGAAAGNLVINYQGMLQYGASFNSARAVQLVGGPSFEYSAIDTNGFNGTLSGQITGVGGILKVGAGTLVLTNAGNNFELGAMVDEGVLQQGAAGAFTANAAYGVDASGTLDLNDFDLTASYLFGTAGGIVDLGTATLTVSSPAALEYDFSTLDSLFEGQIIGAGSLVKEGDAILRLASANGYQGGTTISGGTLQTDNIVALGSGPVTINNTGILQPISGLSIESLLWDGGNVRLPLQDLVLLHVQNAFTNGGGVQTFILDYDNATPLKEQYTLLRYGGPTNFTSADFDGELGITIPNVAVQTHFLLTPDAVLLTLTAQAWGPLLQNSAPVLIPTFADFFVRGAVRTGELDENNVIKSLTFDPGSSLQVYNQLEVTSGNFTVTGGKAVLQGGSVVVPGEFHKLGAGTLDARSQVVVQGNSYIHSGALAVNGTFQTPLLQVLPGGTLMGNGIVIGNVRNSGTVAPGSSIGLLTIRGNYTQTPRGTLEIEVDSPSRHDVLVVSGTARLGGTLEIQSLGYRPKYGDQIPFLRAGKITGRFQRIEMPDPRVNRGRFLNLGNVGVLLVAPTSYTLVATTPNQTRVARALDKWIGIEEGDIGETTLALDLLREEQYPQAFDAIMPGFHGAALSTAIELSHSQGQLLHQQLSARRLGQRAMQRELGQAPSPMAGGSKQGKYVQPAQPQLAPADDSRWSAWMQGSGLFSQGGLSLTPGESFESGTFLVGADYALSEHFAVGLFASYGEGWGDYDNGGQIDVERVSFGAYATVDLDGFYLNGAVGAGTVDLDIRRPIQFATLQRRASSDPQGTEVFALFGGGYDVRRGNWTFGPQFSIQYTRVSLDTFTERGADSLDLRIQEAEAESLRSYLGARVAYTIKVSERVALIPELRAFWQHEFLDGDSMQARLAGGSGPGFLYEMERDDRDALFLGAGLGLQIGPRFYANLYYNVDLGRNEPNHNVSISATWRF